MHLFMMRGHRHGGGKGGNNNEHRH
jgi:hypothetical protein